MGAAKMATFTRRCLRKFATYGHVISAAEIQIKLHNLKNKYRVHTGEDYIKQAEDFTTNEREAGTFLCCREYIKQQHNIPTCCKCEDFDLVSDRWMRCKHPEAHLDRVMLLTFQDRLRIPWRDGAKQVSLDALVPIIAIPLMIAIAAINLYAACIMLITTCIFLAYAFYILKRTLLRTKFFFVWSCWSVVNMVLLFEVTMPLLELLPEENFVLLIFLLLSVYCLWKARQRAPLNHVVQSTVDEDELPDITEEEEEQQTSLLLEQVDDLNDDRYHPSICQICRKYVQPRTSHCSVCQACIVRHDHHSYWLDCCIGEANHRYYLLGLIFAELGLLLCSNLTITAVCHPFLVMRLGGVPVMLPDDCSDVFDEYELAIAFIIGVYALIMAAYIFIALLKQFFLISKGTTMAEYKRGPSSNRKSLLSNWKAFIF